MSTVQLPDWLRDGLMQSGLAKPATPVTVQGPAPAAPMVVNQPPIVTRRGFIQPVWFPRLRMALKHHRKRGALLFGPRGTGKTTAVHALCQSLGLTLHTVQACKGATLDDLKGTNSLVDGPHGSVSRFDEGPLVDALRQDCVLLIEEANMMHAGVFSAMNTLLDGSGDALRLPCGERIKPGPGFRVVLAYNDGAGYSGAGEVNEALKDRLLPIYTRYMDETDEVRMLQDQTGVDAGTAFLLVKWANSVRAASLSFDFDLSPRALFDILDMIPECGYGWDQAFESAILDRIGGPMVKQAERDSIRLMAETAGIFNAPLPTFSQSNVSTGP